MEHIGKQMKLPEKPAKGAKRPTERGELLKEFAGRIGKPIGYVAMRLTGFKLQDLYYLKSTCDDAERRGTPWAKVFYGSIKERPKEGV